MYIFVRITAWIFMLLGALALLAGLFMLGTGLVQMATQTQTPPTGFPMMAFTGSNIAFAGLVVLIQGLVTMAFGQLMIVIVDIARSTQETAVMLRTMRRADQV